MSTQVFASEQPFVQKEHKLFDEKEIQGALTNVDISTADDPAVQIVTGAEKFAVSVTFTSESDSADQALLSDSYALQVDGTLHVYIHPEFYSCDQQMQGDEIKEVQGACITAVRVELPASLSTLPVSAGFKVANGVLGFPELLKKLNEDVFYDDKTAAIQGYVNQPGAPTRMLTVAQMTDVLKALSDDGFRLDACEAASGHISDPADAEKISSAFDSGSGSSGSEDEITVAAIDFLKK